MTRPFAWRHPPVLQVWAEQAVKTLGATYLRRPIRASGIWCFRLKKTKRPGRQAHDDDDETSRESSRTSRLKTAPAAPPTQINKLIEMAQLANMSNRNYRLSSGRPESLSESTACWQCTASAGNALVCGESRNVWRRYLGWSSIAAGTVQKTNYNR